MKISFTRNRVATFLVGAASLAALGLGAYWLATRQPGAKLPEDDRIVARVNGAPISEYDVDLAVKKGFSKTAQEVLEGPQRKQLIESLIQARAIAVAREAELTPLEQAELEKQVLRQREDLLVKQFVIKYGKPEELSVEELRKYYDSHLKEYGAAPVRTYELVTTETRLSGVPRDDVVRELAKAAATPDWFEWVKALREKGMPVIHYRGEMAGEMMKAQLATVAEKLKVGTSSEVTMIEGRPHVVRLITETKGTAKPFESVANEIRERLAPVVLSRAAKKAAEEAMKKVEVVRY